MPELDDTPEFAAAASLFRAVIAERYFESMMRWLEARPEEPEEWQLAAQFGDRFLYLTPHELAELGEQIRALADAYTDRTTRPDLRPPGSREISFLQLAFPAIRPGAGRAGSARAPGSKAVSSTDDEKGGKKR